jgi:hypothetical protein
LEPWQGQLCAVVGTTEQFWLNLQDAYDVSRAEERLAQTLKEIKPRAGHTVARSRASLAHSEAITVYAQKSERVADYCDCYRTAPRDFRPNDAYNLLKKLSAKGWGRRSLCHATTVRSGMFTHRQALSLMRERQASDPVCRKSAATQAAAANQSFNL